MRRYSGCTIASCELPRADAVVWSGHSGVEVILEILNLHGASVGRCSKGSGRAVCLCECGCTTTSYELPCAGAVVLGGHSGVEVVLEVLNQRGVCMGRCSKEAGRAFSILVPEHVIAAVMGEGISIVEIIEIAMVKIPIMESVIKMIESMVEMIVIKMMVIIEHERR